MEDFDEVERQGKIDMLRYFDRIHDKLMSVNTILIAAYLALIGLKKQINAELVLIPLATVMILVFIDMKLMEKSRQESKAWDFTTKEIEKYGKRTSSITWLSIFAFIGTLTGVIIFIKQIR